MVIQLPEGIGNGGNFRNYYPWQSAVYSPFTILCPAIPER